MLETIALSPSVGTPFRYQGSARFIMANEQLQAYILAYAVIVLLALLGKYEPRLRRWLMRGSRRRKKKAYWQLPS